MIGLFRRLAVVSVSLLVLAGCSLPRGAALQSEILAANDNAQPEFAVYPVTRNFLNKVARWPLTGGFRQYGWIAQPRLIETAIIAADDVISLSIWDSDENSLLTTVGQRVVSLDSLLVSKQGTIFIPYIDTVRVSGLTSEQARQKIQNLMIAIIPSAQVQLSVVTGRHGAADLVGGVANPGSYPLPDDSVSVLNLVSLGGGVPSALRNPQVRLVREGRVYGTSIRRLYANPAQDTILRGGDKVIVAEDKRYFLSLGAAGTESLFYFEQDQITALDAMSLIGGISDTRADPEGILILREYNKGAVRSGDSGPSHVRSIFTIDLTTADGLFSARKFLINPGDLVLVTESPVNAIETILSLVGTAALVSNRVN